MVNTRDDAANPPVPSTNPKPGDPARRENGDVQGEGNYAAARKFNEAERRFVASGKVAAAAQAAAPRSEAEQREMIDAEAEGKRRAQTRRPDSVRTSSKPVTLKVPRKKAPTSMK